MPTYPNQGPDSRLDLFGILAWAQNLLSFKSAKPPRWLIKFTGRFQYWFTEKREYVVLGIAWPPYFVWQGVAQQGKIVAVEVSPEHPDGLEWEPGKVTMIRFGWRYDVPWQGYIAPTVAVKVRSLPHPMELGY